MVEKLKNSINHNKISNATKGKCCNQSEREITKQGENTCNREMITVTYKVLILINKKKTV